MIKKCVFFIPLAILFLSGCATYSFKKGEAPYNNGFVAARYDRVIPEYTIGKDNSVPDEQVARERFQRRRSEVESYYKKMGYIENRFKQSFVDPPVFMIQAFLGIFRLPSVAIDDYKYNHDPQYKNSVDKKEDAEYKAEKERLKALREQLNVYIQEDLQKEALSVPAEQKSAAVSKVKVKIKPAPKTKEPVQENALTKAPQAAKEERPAPEKVKEAAAPSVVHQEPLRESAAANEIVLPVVAVSGNPQAIAPALIKDDKPLKSPVAVIIAKPLTGNSPLLVQFDGSKSYSSSSRIVSYFWDFGDGDSSTRRNPSNTYWSTTYGKPRQYTARLTVKDSKGNTGDASVIIEVLTR
ncbi:MAG: PKD domain-containing protein [Candidatus Omnitrophota bacterium]